MDLKGSITAAMEEIMQRSKVTIEGGNNIPAKNNDLSRLSKEERDFYKLMFGDDIASVRHRKLHCTACDVHIGSAPINSVNMFAHPVLFTLLCSNCRNFYGDGDFEQGEDATDMFCRWCANGGNLYCCSYCSNTFCNKCIKRNFDPVVRKKIEDEEKWKCFVCDPTDLYTARAICWALLQHVKTVARILKNDRNMSKDEFKEKMNLDESKCCVKKRKVKRRKLNSNGSDEDESYFPSMEELPVIQPRHKILKRSPRLSLQPNGEQNKTLANIKPKQELFNAEEDDEDELPPPMIPCVQSMVEGDNSETITETLISHSQTSEIPTSADKTVLSTPQTIQINPIPTVNLLKIAPAPPPLTPIINISGSRKRIRGLQQILPAPNTKFIVVQNSSTQNCPSQSTPTIPIISTSLQSSLPMVTIPNTTTTSSPIVHTVEYGSLPFRAQSLSPGTFKKTSTSFVQTAKPASTSVKDAGVIEINIDSDSDDAEKEELANRSRGENANQEVLKNMSNSLAPDNSKAPDSFAKRRSEKPSNIVEEEIDFRTEEVRTLFKMIGTKLRRVPLLHLPNHNNLRSTRVKTRRFHHALTNAISILSDINDKVVHKYSNWRKSMLENSGQTVNSETSTTAKESAEDMDIPLDMICTNSESESENDNYDSDSMFITEKIRNVKSFQERDTVDIAIGDRVSTADKSVQAFDVVERDYEKCIGHSVLTKIEYDPVDGSEILKPVIVPVEYNGKFEEQFIFYLQEREELEIQTDDDKGLPDPNETPLKDLIESNSPFVLEMLENIESPLGKDVTEINNESGKKNENQSEPTNVVKELAKIVTELTEDLKTGKDGETLSKKYTEQGKKDRRKETREGVREPEEVDIAVQTLIEEDERSRSSSNDDDTLSRHAIKPLTNNEKGEAIESGEDECTIIE